MNGGSYTASFLMAGPLAAASRARAAPEERPSRNADPPMGGNGAPEVARQQDRSQYGSGSNRIRDDTDEQDDAQAEDDARRVTELSRPLYDRSQSQQFADGIEGQEQDREAAHDASGPDPFPRGGSGPCLGRARGAGLLDRLPFLGDHFHASGLPLWSEAALPSGFDGVGAPSRQGDERGRAGSTCARFFLVLAVKSSSLQGSCTLCP